MLTRLRLVALGAVVALAVSACITPTVPVPPPDPESFSFALDMASGTATFTSGPQAEWGGARVDTYNYRTGRGIITTARDDGSVGPTVPFEAVDGDQILIGWVLEEEQSYWICLVLHEGPSSDDFRCP